MVGVAKAQSQGSTSWRTPKKSPTQHKKGCDDLFDIVDVPNASPYKPPKASLASPGGRIEEELKLRFVRALGLPWCLCGKGADPRRQVREVGASKMSVQVCERCGGLC